MILAATIITGNTEQIIGESVRSVVEHVDMICVIDTGITDRTREVVLDAALTCRVSFATMAWQHDFALARNKALHFAAECGADWTLMVDTDERIVWREDVDQPKLLQLLTSDPLVDVWCALDAERTHARERLIRCSRRLRWKGAVHETLIKKPGKLCAGLCDLFSVAEIRKTSKQVFDKMQRDAEVMAACHAAEPDESRWIYYLGEANEGLGQLEEAIRWYRYCATGEHAGYGAWSAYRCARLLFQMGDVDESHRMCQRGLELNSAMPELFWLTGLNWYRREQFILSARFARFAIRASAQFEKHLIGTAVAFRDIAAWNELPYDLLAWSCLRLGDDAGYLKGREIANNLRRQRSGTNCDREGDLNPDAIAANCKNLNGPQ